MGDLFRVGDKVWDRSYGWGEVEKVDKERAYAVSVSFDCSTESYTSDGRYQSYAIERSLFFEEVEIPKSALSRPRFRAKRDAAYYYIDETLGVLSDCEGRTLVDDKRWNAGNYFKSSEEAEEYRDRFSELILNR